MSRVVPSGTDPAHQTCLFQQGVIRTTTSQGWALERSGRPLGRPARPRPATGQHWRCDGNRSSCAGLRVVCAPCRSRRKADGQVQEHLPIQTLIGRAMVLVTMRSSGEVQPPGAVHGAGIDPARALLRRHRFRSKASWHGERHWQPAANWIPQPRSARIHWMGVSGTLKESTDGAISSKSRWLASSGRGGHFFHSKRVRAASRDRFELRSHLWGDLGRTRYI